MATQTLPIVRVLFLEDSPAETRHVLRILKEATGAQYHADHAGTVADLAAKAASGVYDIALIDLCVPDSEGLATVKKVRELVPDLPIVVQSGLEDEALAIEAVRLGAQDYIVKEDVDARSLPRALRYALERWSGEKALRESEERYALAVQGANDGLWDWDLRTQHVHYAPRWKMMLGLDVADLEPRPESWFERVHPEDADAFAMALQLHLDARAPHLEFEYRIRHCDGTYRWVLCRGLAVRDAAGNAYRLAGSHTDITERKRMEERLAYDAFHDPLTSLPNRALLMDRLGQALRRRKRAGLPFALLFLDLDRFKLVNDGLGHATGDKMLQEIAHRLQAAVRPGDTVARLGGDEFVVLLEPLQSPGDAQLTADRIQHELRKVVRLDGRELYTSASIGVLSDVDGYTHPEELLRDADTAMYRAKGHGRGRAETFDRALHNDAMQRLELEMELRRALDRGELLVHYQPIVSVTGRNTVRFEALLRWASPRRGLVSPAQFVPILEETGLIVPVGLWVLEEVCRQIQQWRADGAFGGQQMAVSINVSTRQFEKGDLVESVTNVLEKSGVPPHCVALEITESLLMERPNEAAESLARLRKLGVGIDLDDFGTGYSSLAYLQRFPVDTLKIDRSFVNNLGNGTVEADGDGEIVRAIIGLARNLGLRVVAEGVENVGQLDRLRDLECDFAQGFYFARPMPGKPAPILPVH